MTTARTSLSGLVTLLVGISILFAQHATAKDSQLTTIEATGPEGPLKGAYQGVVGDAKAIALIIPGSGPTDRDGNSPLGIKSSTYRLIAEGLAQEGIASVRIDKRGMFKSAAAVSDPNAVTIPDYVSDIAAWVNAIQNRNEVQCIWLIGHSEGGLVALSAAQEIDGICGLVLLATPGRPLGEILKEQLRANPANAPLLEAADRAIERLAAGQRVDAKELPDPLLPLFRPAVQGFLISSMAIDPTNLVENAKLPILIVQGGKDLQVSLKDAELLKAANPSATLAILPDANHILKDVPGDSAAENIQTYSDPDMPLSENLIGEIASFIERE